MTPRIPRISSKNLHELAGRIKPVGRLNPGGALRFYADCAPHDCFSVYDELLNAARGLVELVRIETWFTAGSTMGVYQFFPTAAEVIAQIPVTLRNHVVAFEVVSPDFSNGSVEDTPYLKERGRAYHKAETILYTRKAMNRQKRTARTAI